MAPKGMALALALLLALLLGPASAAQPASGTIISCPG
jgi:hypothetical protein